MFLLSPCHHSELVVSNRCHRLLIFYMANGCVCLCVCKGAYVTAYRTFETIECVFKQHAGFNIKIQNDVCRSSRYFPTIHFSINRFFFDIPFSFYSYTLYVIEGTPDNVFAHFRTIEFLNTIFLHKTYLHNNTNHRSIAKILG